MVFNGIYIALKIYLFSKTQCFHLFLMLYPSVMFKIAFTSHDTCSHLTVGFSLISAVN